MLLKKDNVYGTISKTEERSCLCSATCTARFHWARDAPGVKAGVGGVVWRGRGGVISERVELELQGQHLPSGHQALISITGRWRGAARHL